MDESTSDHTHPPSRQQAAVGGSRASSKATHAPSAKLWKQVNVHRTLRPLHGPLRARSLHSTSLPYCGYVGGPDGPACTVSGCRELPSRLAGSWGPSDSAMRFSSPGVLPSSGASTSQQWRQRCPWLVRGISVLLAKDVMVPVPPADMKAGFFSPYFIVPKKSGGLRPILGLRILMLMQNRVFGCIRPQVRSAALTWRPVLPCVDPSVPQAIPAVCVQRTSISVQVLPFGLSLSPRVFTKVAEAALVPLREQGVRILNYLDDWLILAQSQDQLCEHRDWCSRTSASWAFGSTGKRANSCRCRGSLFSVWSLDLVNQTARLTQERAQSVLNCLNTFKNRTRHHWNGFSRLLGHMAAAAAVTPLGLLHMRPLQHWLHGRVPRWAWQSGTLRVQVTPACRQTFTPWSDLSFLGAGVPLEQVSRHTVVYTDASAKGWGATFNGHAVSGVWTGPQLHWHINCLELLAVHLALNRLKRRLRGEHVLVRTDNTATVAYINRQGGLRSRRMSQLARHLLLWSRKHLRSLRAIHIPGLLNRTADELSRAAHPGEWRLHPQTVQLIWRCFGLAQVDLFAYLETSHCQLFYSQTDGTLGTDALAHSWPRGLRKYAFPPVSLLAQTLCKGQRGRGADPARGTILAYQDLVPRADAPRDSPSLADSSEEGSTDSETGHLMAPASRPLETSCLVPRRDMEVLGDLPQEVVDTITSARAPSTRHAYALKWNLFVEWCSSHREDPRRCPIRVVLSFLQQGLERRLSPSTLKVYVAAIAANHDPVEGKSVGKHDWVVRFLRGARRLNPPRPPSIHSWDLSLVLRALQQGPFEPLQTVEPKFLSMKTLLLFALASIKRVGDLHAFSVDDSCLQFGPADSQIILRPRPGYVPKVPTTPFRDQVVSLQAMPPEEADPALALLVPSRHWDTTLTGRKASGPQTSSLSVTEAGRKGMPSPSRGWPTG